MEKFTYEYYEEFIKTLKNNNYEFVFFNDTDKIKNEDTKIVILRHDIDFDVKKAKKISEIEKKHNVKSTFFFLLNSKFYNIHNSEIYQMIKEITDEGNKIGIHFDEASYKYSTSKELTEFIIKEIGFFEKLFKQKVNIISFHRPTSNILLNKIKIPIAHTYQELYAKQIKYLSDSKKQLREGDLIEIIKNEKYKKLQILLHPFWWGDTNTTAQNDYDQYIKYKENELKKEITSNSGIYQHEEQND